MKPPEPVEDLLSTLSATWLVTFKRRSLGEIHRIQAAAFRQADDNRREADVMEEHEDHFGSLGVTCLKGATYGDQINVPGSWEYITRYQLDLGGGNRFYKASG